MKTDPNICCVVHAENRVWAIVHDAIAHPLMALTLYAGFAKRFHDYTSARAWPRGAATPSSGANPLTPAS